MGIVAYWADQGRVTGGGPSDPKAYMAWRAAGNQPYSMKLDDDSQWYSYQRIEPFASIFGAAADMVELGQTNTSEETVGRAMSMIKDNLTNKTYMLGIENMLKAWADPKRYGENWIETLAGSSIPAFVGGIARANDPINRRQSGAAEAIMARIPGQREKLEPRYTITGKVSERDHPILSAITPFSPVDTKPENVVEGELARLGRLGYSIPDLPRRTKRIRTGLNAKADEMTQDEYAILMSWTRQANDILAPMISSPSWNTMDDDTKLDVIRSVFDKMRRPGHIEVSSSMKNRLLN